MAEGRMRGMVSAEVWAGAVRGEARASRRRSANRSERGWREEGV
jgi:hypothetical protein